MPPTVSTHLDNRYNYLSTLLRLLMGRKWALTSYMERPYMMVWLCGEYKYRELNVEMRLDYGFDYAAPQHLLHGKLAAMQRAVDSIVEWEMEQ